MVEVNWCKVNCNPWLVTRLAGIPNLATQWWMNILVMVSELMLLMGTASNHLENLSIIVRM